MTLSLAAVFIPVLFMGGILGRLLHEFAVTIAVAVLVSGFVSLTLTPMLCSRFVKPPARNASRPGLLRHAAVLRRACCGLYDRSLQVCPAASAHGRWSSRRSCSLATVLSCSWSFPKDFFPSEDTGQIFGVTEAGQDISFEAHARAPAGPDADRERRTPTSRTTCPRSARAARPPAGNNGRIFMRLKPRSPSGRTWTRSSRICAASWPPFPGISVFLQNPPLIRIGGTLTKSLYQFTMQGSGPEGTLPLGADHPGSNMAELPGFQDVTTDLQINSPQVIVDIDRDKARALGVTADQIENALYDAYGSRQVSTIYAPVNQYWVIMEVAARISARPVGLVASLHPFDQRQTRAAARRGEDQPRRRPADRQPFWPTAGSHDLLQSRARRRRWARPWTT